MVQEKAGSIMRELRDMDKESKRQTDQLDYKTGMFAIGHHVNAVQEKYREYERVISYINAVQEDVLENISQFVEEEEDGEDSLASLLPMLGKKPAEDVTLKYKVNLIVDHSDSKGAPIVVTFNPTYNNLVGEVEYDSEFGNLTTDFMKIKGGLFHKANGGYLLVQAAGYPFYATGMGGTPPRDEDQRNQHGLHTGAAGCGGCAHPEAGADSCKYQGDYDWQQLLL